MVMLVRLLHAPNAQSPIAVTLAGMVTLVRLSHPANAISPIKVTPFGMVTFAALPWYLTNTVPFISKSVLC
jgi:hypothetical protein